MLQIKQGRPTQDKNERPSKADAESEVRGRELGDSEPYQGYCGKVGSSAEEKVKQAGDIRSHATDEVHRIFRGMSMLRIG